MKEFRSKKAPLERMRRNVDQLARAKGQTRAQKPNQGQGQGKANSPVPPNPAHHAGKHEDGISDGYRALRTDYPRLLARRDLLEQKRHALGNII